MGLANSFVTGKCNFYIDYHIDPSTVLIICFSLFGFNIPPKVNYIKQPGVRYCSLSTVIQAVKGSCQFYG
ncbi:hypothetical protein WN48_05013 [Eufriesea mexicana]|nr:hypothetical protein WN48_05013 [Eufriesea mexicana]